MTPKPFPKLLREVPSHAPARLKRTVSNASVEMPAGMVGRLSPGATWRSFSFKGAPCPHCGVRAYIHGLTTAELELVDLEEGESA